MRTNSPRLVRVRLLRVEEDLVQLRADEPPRWRSAFATACTAKYRMSVWMADRIVRTAAKRAGLTEDVSPHWLRHAAIAE